MGKTIWYKRGLMDARIAKSQRRKFGKVLGCSQKETYGHVHEYGDIALLLYWLGYQAQRLVDLVTTLHNVCSRHLERG